MADNSKRSIKTILKLNGSQNNLNTSKITDLAIKKKFMSILNQDHMCLNMTSNIQSPSIHNNNKLIISQITPISSKYHHTITIRYNRTRGLTCNLLSLKYNKLVCILTLLHMCLHKTNGKLIIKTKIITENFQEFIIY